MITIGKTKRDCQITYSKKRLVRDFRTSQFLTAMPTIRVCRQSLKSLFELYMYLFLCCLFFQFFPQIFRPQLMVGSFIPYNTNACATHRWHCLPTYRHSRASSVRLGMFSVLNIIGGDPTALTIQLYTLKGLIDIRSEIIKEAEQLLSFILALNS